MRDENNIPKLIAALEELDQYQVEIGIFSEDGNVTEDGEDILSIAYVHEFGSIIRNIPERSFMRAGFDTNISKIEQQIELLLGQVMDLKLDAKGFYEAIGAVVTGIIQEYLTDLQEPPLSPVTIERKGSSNPLIDTGRLRQSITYKVVEVNV